MSRRTKLLDVAWWEFRRFVKTKDLILSLLLVAAAGVGIRMMSTLVESAQTDSVAVIAIPAEHLPLEPGDYGRFHIAVSDAGEDELREQLVKKDVDAVLVFANRDEAIIVVRSEALWQRELETILSGARKDQRLAASGISAEELETLVRPLSLQLAFADEDKATRSSGRTGAMVMLGLMYVGLLIGFSYLLVGLTAEKTQRVTEQLIAAISPQTWVDGKILGLSGLVMANLLVYVLGYLVYKLIAVLVWGDPLDLPVLISDPVVFAGIFVLTLLGFFMWFTFFGVVASTVSDPNTSTRSVIMMVPMLPIPLAVAVLSNPDAGWLQVFSVFPLTSPTVLSARLVLADVAFWEFPLAVLLLAATIWFLRRTAGKIFGISMLMYGKEPKWSEVIRWAREAP